MGRLIVMETWQRAGIDCLAGYWAGIEVKKGTSSCWSGGARAGRDLVELTVQRVLDRRIRRWNQVLRLVVVSLPLIEGSRTGQRHTGIFGRAGMRGRVDSWTARWKCRGRIGWPRSGRNP